MSAITLTTLPPPHIRASDDTTTRTIVCPVEITCGMVSTRRLRMMLNYLQERKTYSYCSSQCNRTSPPERAACWCNFRAKVTACIRTNFCTFQGWQPQRTLVQKDNKPSIKGSAELWSEKTISHSLWATAFVSRTTVNYLHKRQGAHVHDDFELIFLARQ